MAHQPNGQAPPGIWSRYTTRIRAFGWRPARRAGTWRGLIQCCRAMSGSYSPPACPVPALPWSLSTTTAGAPGALPSGERDVGDCGSPAPAVHTAGAVLPVFCRYPSSLQIRGSADRFKGSRRGQLLKRRPVGSGEASGLECAGIFRHYPRRDAITPSLKQSSAETASYSQGLWYWD